MKLPLNAFYTWYSQTLRHPKYRWWIIIGSLIYLFSPLDISPDLLPIIGQLDDIAIVGLLIAELSQMAMEYMKARQSAQTQASDAAQPGSGEPIPEPIDVNAVTVE